MNLPYWNVLVTGMVVSDPKNGFFFSIKTLLSTDSVQCSLYSQVLVKFEERAPSFSHFSNRGAGFGIIFSVI